MLNFVNTFNVDKVRQILLGRGERVMRAAAEYALDSARVLAPVDTGNLRQSLGIQPIPNRGGRNIIGWRLYAGAHYGAYQEEGWTTRAGNVVPGKHFMKRAINMTAVAFPSIASAYQFEQTGGRHPQAFGNIGPI